MWQFKYANYEHFVSFVSFYLKFFCSYSILIETWTLIFFLLFFKTQTIISALIISIRKPWYETTTQRIFWLFLIFQIACKNQVEQYFSFRLSRKYSLNIPLKSSIKHNNKIQFTSLFYFLDMILHYVSIIKVKVTTINASILLKWNNITCWVQLYTLLCFSKHFFYVQLFLYKTP